MNGSGVGELRKGSDLLLELVEPLLELLDALLEGLYRLQQHLQLLFDVGDLLLETQSEATFNLLNGIRFINLTWALDDLEHLVEVAGAVAQGDLVELLVLGLHSLEIPPDQYPFSGL